MTQNNLYMEDDNMRLYVDVQPLFIDELETSKNAAAASAMQAAQSEANARTWKNDIEDYKTGLELFYAQATDGITNSYNSSISGLSAAKTSAISDLNTQKNSIQNSLNSSLNSAINNITTNGQSYVNQARNYAEEAQRTVDNRVSKDHLNQSKGLETGSVSTDEEVLSDIKKYAHSTFCGVQTQGNTPGYLSDGITPLDPKKFTKLGSPIVTSDGIASGFSSSNYLKSSVNLSSLKNKSWSVTNKWVDNGAVITGTYDWFTLIGVTSNLLGVKGNLLVYKATKKVRFVGEFGDSSSSESGSIEYTFTTMPSSFVAKLDFNYPTGKYILYLDTGNGFFEAGHYTPTTTEKQIKAIAIEANFQVSCGFTDPTKPADSIDLKQLSITVDGVEVFSGNKTGIDTIKPDDYTVVGTPTISADGVASGFSSSNYIKVPLTLTATNKFKIYLNFKTNTDVSTGQNIFGFDSNEWNRLDVANGRLTFTVMDNGPKSNFATALANTEYFVILGLDDTGYYFTVSTTEFIDSEADKARIANVTTNITNTSYGFLGVRSSANSAFGGSIDLNAFKIYVDGDLVYQPCLKIPYTESKTGSKIVDSIYRNRVTDMYQQFGYAPYYTLSDTDFTLPMGDIYGMIEGLRKLIIQRTS